MKKSDILVIREVNKKRERESECRILKESNRNYVEYHMKEGWNTEDEKKWEEITKKQNGWIESFGVHE